MIFLSNKTANPIIIAFLLITVTALSAQQRFLEATHQNGSKIVLFEEGKRVKGYYAYKNHVGNLRIISNDTIAIGESIIPVNELMEIKKRPKSRQIVKQSLIVTTFIGLMAFPYVGLVAGKASLIPGGIGISSLGAAGVLEFGEKKYAADKWIFRVIQTDETDTQ